MFVGFVELGDLVTAAAATVLVELAVGGADGNPDPVDLRRHQGHHLSSGWRGRGRPELVRGGERGHGRGE